MRMIFPAIAALVLMTQHASAGQIWLTMDQVRPYKLETSVNKIVVGNPSIADVTVQDNNNLLLFGKGPGLTNIYMFDENSETIENLIVRVRSPSTDMLTVHRGAARTTYNCTTNCEATVTVGDDTNVFNGISTQIRRKFREAAGAAEAADSED